MNVGSLRLECASIALESIYIYILFCLFLCGSETMIWKEKERSRIRAVQMDNLRGLLSVRRMDRVLNGREGSCVE